MLAPLNTGGDALTFGLCEGTVDSDQELAFWVDGVDILLLKDDRDAHAAQFAGIVQRVHGITGEAGDGFRKDHAKKILALAGGSACDAFIRKNIRHRPVGVCHDFFRVVCFLVFVAVELLVLFRGHAAVCGYPEIFLLFLILRRFLLCGNHDDLRFRAGLRHVSSHSSKT